MARTWHIGTRYHTQDTYREIIDRGSVKVRMYPATDDGKETGNPVLITRERLAVKRAEMGPYVFGAQMLQDPTADKAQGFKEEWLRYWAAEKLHNLNFYLLCDPANAKKKGSDYTVFMVIGLGADKKMRVATIVRDRLNLGERTKMLFKLHRDYHPLAVGYEQYGKDSDIQHIQHVQKETNYDFEITELGGKMAKDDRIKRLVPDFEKGLILLPEDCIRMDYQQHTVNLTKSFINEEYKDFPVVGHDDMLDCLSRIKDMPDLQWPIEDTRVTQPEWQKKIANSRGMGSWKTR